MEKGDDGMDTNKIGQHAMRVVRELEETDLKIDEKIAALRSAADILQEVMAMETVTLTIQETMRLQLDKWK